MDQGRLEELKRLLQKRCGSAKQNRSEELGVENSETENSETENSEASNFETPNSDPDALNLKAELEAEADHNSACKNSMEPQNFTSNDSGSLWQNSKVRDYDKYPLVIKDHTY